MSNTYYKEALSLGKKEIQSLTSRHMPTDLPALDDITAGKEILGEVSLGLIDIPMELIAGTKTKGRSPAFAPNYMPILDESSEFAAKWEFLYEAQISEGIREPVKAYEYLNHYYILEGNKRVSVLKYCGAVSVPGYVTRLMPARSDSSENRIYYEYLDFYNATSINYVIFTQEGSYNHLTWLLGKQKYERWNMEERMNFRSAYNRFSEAYEDVREKDSSLTAGDALLIYLDLFGYAQLCDETPSEISENLTKIKSELKLADNNREISVKLDPEPEAKPKKTILNRILPAAKGTPQYRIAFINMKDPETSSWTYGHELGRIYLEEHFPGEVTTAAYNNVAGTDQAIDAIEDAIQNDCDIIFTTSPEFLQASLKAAVNHPEAKILNCSLNTPHKYIRTYYGRMYEAKFLNGVLAGILSSSNRIGYVADYPIYGLTANINAFALGARMVNPESKIFLEWSTSRENQGVNLTEKFLSKDITLISNQDMITPGQASRQFGLYRIDGKQPVNLACPIWDWGKYYERILRNIQNGNWEKEEKSEEARALNYWWGMSAGVIDIIWSPEIDWGTRKLLEILKESICKWEFHPFSGVMTAQDGTKHGSMKKPLSVQEIMTMNWLCDNIDGSIPSIGELKEEAHPVVQLRGTNREEEN